MLHPQIELRFVDEHIGYGTFATRLIPRGTITWVRDDLDQTFAPAIVAQMPEKYRDILEKYSFVDGRGDHVLCWDHGRFVNHACRPTCLSPGFDFEIAIRDILPGEELTDDYGTLNVESSFDCRCGADDCRKVVRPDDPSVYGERWDAIVREAFPSIGLVDQPLWWLVKEKAEVESALAGHTPVPSCVKNWVGRDRSDEVR